jgi:hypothetical protein
MTRTGKRELTAELRLRYRQAKQAERTRILDEFVAVTGYHRKHAIRLLRRPPSDRPLAVQACRHLIYGPKVVHALTQVWEASDQLCSDRLHAFLPIWLEVLEAHGELVLDPTTKALLLSMSRATIDRKLCPVRRQLKQQGLSTTRSGTWLKNQIPVRTFAQWDDLRPGVTEVDLVAHCGQTTRGEYPQDPHLGFLNTLVMVDLATGWVECRAVPWRSQREVFAALQVFRDRLPMPLLGIDPDNDSAFINDHLWRYTQRERITFTRCRAYKKNDQAHVEERNGHVIRRLVGYDRFEGLAAAKSLNAVYDNLRLWVNFFQPSMKLLRKERRGSKVRKFYAPAKTPYQAVLEASEVPEATKRHQQDLFRSINPIALRQTLDQRLEAFWRLAMVNNPG